MNLREIFFNIKNSILLLFFLPFAILNYMYIKKIKLLIILIISIIISILVCLQYTNIDYKIIDYTNCFNNKQFKTNKNKYIILHHVAGNATISDLVYIHYKQNKWNSIGYNYFIDFDGTIYHLKNDDQSTPNAIGFNNNSISICFNGDFNDKSPTELQYKAGIFLIKKLIKIYNINKENIKGHNEVNITECPGVLFNKNKIIKCL